jgi:fused signal recognition particle receptor
MLRLFGGTRGDRVEKAHKAIKNKQGAWLRRMVALLASPKLDSDVWDQIEEILVSADVGLETSVSLIEKLKKQATDFGHRDIQQIIEGLKTELVSLLETPAITSDFMAHTATASPFVILVVGVNGVGKTTSIAKMAHTFKDQGKKVVLGAADTFRAGAIEQLQILGEMVGVEIIAHREHSDPGAVVFDAFKASQSRGADVLIIDTAGRLHTKTNLMEELKKIYRVLHHLDEKAPHMVILTLDATTGQNGLTQAREFTKAVNCTGIFLTKLDGTARGGIVLTIASELALPILFIGTGEQVQDMVPFFPKEFVDALLAPAP